MALLPPSNLAKGLGGCDATVPQDTPSVADRNSKNNNNKKKKSKAKKSTKPRTDQDLEISEAETDTTANVQTDLDTDADAEADVEVEAEIDVDEMPKRPPPPPKRDVDISLIVNWQQRLQFDALNQAIIANIEAQVMKPFNFLDHPVAKQHRVKIWNFGPSFAAVQNDTQQPSACDSATDTAKVKENSDAGTKEDADEHTTQPSIARVDANSVQAAVPSMNLLKEEATQYFNKWKATFSKRCNDLIVPKQSNSDASTSRQGQGALRGGGTGTGRGGRYQQEVNKGIAYQADLYMIRRFPPVETPLCNLSVDKRRALIHIMILMLLSTEHYISYARLYLLYLASSLHIPSWAVTEDENRIAFGLGKIYKTLCEEAEVRELEEKKALEEQRKMTDALKPIQDESSQPRENSAASDSGHVDVAQGAVPAQEVKVVQEANRPPPREPKKKWRPNPNPVHVGNTLLSVGLGMIPEGQGLPSFRLPPVTVAHLMGPLGDCEAAVGIFFGVNPYRPSIRSLDTMAQIVTDGAFIPLHCPIEHPHLRDAKDLAPTNRRMRLVICINGLLTDKDDSTSPWNSLGHHNEVLSIRWETESLEKIGSAFETLVRSKVWPESLEQLRRTPIMTTMALQAWPDALMRCSKIVDNAWVMGFTKCPKLQQLLTDIIGGHVMGERGITLIGYGLGARAIYLCLAFLAERRMYGLVDTVVLMGAPIPGDAGTWSALKSVVSGRLVNVYSPTDYMLAFASRQMATQFGVAGLDQIQGVGGVENHDVSDILDAHLRYPALVATILKRILWDDLRQELRPPPPQPKLTPIAAPQRPPAGNNKFHAQSAAQGKAKHTFASTENKENALPQRGGRGSRGGGRAGAGTRGGHHQHYHNTDRRIAEEMGKLDLK